MKESFRYTWILIFAVAIVLLAVVYYLYDPPEPATARTTSQPGTDKAVLSVSPGKNFALTGKDDPILTVTGISITDSSGWLMYRGNAASVDTHSLQTPRGGQYRLVLSDGTKVWLNAASGISYPVSFGSGKRIVRITGEVYFEVSKDPRHPFIVQTYREPVQVLGTSFNVNAYVDESVIKVSLVEGSVKVHIYTMQPGDGYSYGDLITTNVYQDVAWAHGRFGFAHTELETAMRQLSRWYDMDIVYPNGAPATYLNGNLDRSTPVARLPEKLQTLGILAKIDNGQLVVSGMLPHK